MKHELSLENIPLGLTHRFHRQDIKVIFHRLINLFFPNVFKFFNNTLMLGKASESEVSDRVYDLIQELNVISPSVLLSVLPQLDFKLKV